MPNLVTASGRLVDPLALRPEDLALEDIADALARRYRWNAAADYTVAQHTIAACIVATEANAPPAVCQWALCHDIAEAYLGDVPQPLRHGLGWYTRAGFRRFQNVENDILHDFAERFSLVWPIPSAVATIDHRLAATEAVAFFGEPLGIPSQPYDGPEILDPLDLAHSATLSQSDAWLALALSHGITDQ